MDRRSRLASLFEDHGWGIDPEARDVEAMERLFGRVDRLFGPGRYFGLEVTGWEHLPAAPAMLVSNHSGGTTIPDVWGFAVAWHRRFGQERPCHVLGHEMIFTLAPVARFMSQMGAVRASPGAARRVLGELRRDLLVLPGGDMDTWRPWTERYKVRFAGRMGYAKLALQVGVPIVPVAHAGAHSTLVVLSDGERLARALGLPKIARASIFPVHLSVPWGLTVGPMPHLPLPVTLRYRVGAPVPPPEGPWPDPDPTPERIAAWDAAVRAEIQRMLDGLKEERRARWRRITRRAARNNHSN